MILLQSRCFEDHRFQVYENERIILGFSEINFPAAALQRFFNPRPLMFLKQIHSRIIVRDQDWRAGSEGDGMLLQKPGVVAVIQTADCLPLFFFADDYKAAGVIHVGWRGLSKEIEVKLLEMLPGNRQKYWFYLGPAIEKKCYPVGEELFQKFNKKPYGESIFSKRHDGKFLMDIKAGLVMSLRRAGVAAGRISDCGLCTFCLTEQFPSYRRDGKTGKRIYNFLSLR
ncbi:MAG: polyphenol oxidase family protein [Candidatus Aminicenantes bacterium]|nr:polyphenol oxidase family protein [Candidatus Aminicenantes bacterium]